MNALRVVAGVVTAGILSAGFPSAGMAQAQTPAQRARAVVQERLKQVAEAYYDVPSLYPGNYFCELRSPEMTAAIEPHLRRAWGQGYLALTATPQGVRASAENVADARAELQPVITRWQNAIAEALRRFEGCLPGRVAAAAMAAPEDYAASALREGALTRLELKAKSPADYIQSVTLWVDNGNALVKFAADDKVGGRLEVALKNVRLRTPQPKLVPVSAEIYAKRAGQEGKHWIEIEYQNVFGEQAHEHVLYRSVKLKRTDARGFLPNQPQAGEVNPVSFQLTNYRVRAPTPPRTVAGTFESVYAASR